MIDDEPAHFINSLLVFDYLRQAPFSNPLHYALNYYMHFPRIAIGQWPPLFYVVQAAVFALGERSDTAAIALQAVIGGLAAGWTALLVQRRLGWPAGLAAGLVVVASPRLMRALNEVMVDTFAALWMFGAALSWASFARRPDWGRAALFALCAIGAIMSKGNGFALALLPPFYALLTREWRPLLDRRAWAAAAAIGVVTLPWYAFASRLGRGPDTLIWSWGYTRHALPGFALGFPETIGIIGVIGFAAGVVRTVRSGHGAADATLVALASEVMAVLAFLLVVPVGIDPRYLIELLPAAVVVAALGLAYALRPFTRRLPLTVGTVVAALLLVDGATIVSMPHVTSFGMKAMAQRILHEGGNPFVLVAGSTRVEGALIAAFAALDPARTHYVLRGTQELSSGSFGGADYKPRFADAREMARWIIGDNGIGWLIVDNSPRSLEWMHDRQIIAILQHPPPGWSLLLEHGMVMLDEGRYLPGNIRLYRLPTALPTPAQRAELLKRVVPSR